MVPCCLKIISREEYERLTSSERVGGNVGKHERCPSDANEAHDLIQKMKPSNTEGGYRYFKVFSIL